MSIVAAKLRPIPVIAFLLFLSLIISINTNAQQIVTADDGSRYLRFELMR
ncbi:MAG: hypothetical protein HGA37_16870, partial [Lentimicrobium sp.]|nr:hypothetical protein [Lentimicrobium sp.]